MRVAASHHVHRLRERPRSGNPIRDALNIPNLLVLLTSDDVPWEEEKVVLPNVQGSGDDVDDEAEVSKSPRGRKGKKRGATASVRGQPPAKRMKTIASTISATRTADKNESAINEEGQSTVPVYRHSFGIHYTTSTANDCGYYIDEATAKQYEWVQNEIDLTRWLTDRAADQSQPQTIDLGRVRLESYGLGYVMAHRPIPQSSAQLLIAPQLYNDFKTEDYDLREFRDVLRACLVLEQTGRVKHTARLQLHVLQPGEVPDPGMLPLRLTLEVTISLIFPAIFQRVVYSSHGFAAATEEAQRRLLLHIFPPNSQTPVAFHGSVDVPFLYSILEPARRLQSLAAEEAIQPAALIPMLLPFQRRTVAWMLNRENKCITDSGEVVRALASSEAERDTELPPLWERVQLDDVQTVYLNRVTGNITPLAPSDSETVPLGGILAEEPGLGKTLECISLILLNPAIERGPTQKAWDPAAKLHVKQTKTTLIVTPISLASQWMDELALHAPTLKVFFYDGWAKVKVPITEEDVQEVRERRLKAAKKTKARAARAADAESTKALGHKRGSGRQKSGAAGKLKAAESDEEMDNEINGSQSASKQDDLDEEDEVVDWCNYVNSFDVCITTYNVLQHDLSVARPPTVRPRRTNTLYSNFDRPRSPLVLCEWYRVIMDEVQMVGGGKAEEMMSLIPRLSSFAVSGTPARAQVADLVHSLKFLRVNAVVDVPKVWTRLLKPGYVNDFVALFRKYAIRTMKTSVKDELTIPKQTRYLVPIELGRVERQVYDQNFDSALLELGLDARGVAVAENWTIDTAVLRTWLRKLRGICTHPQVGQLHGVDRLHKPGVLKTMTEVLEEMREQNWRNYMDDRKSKVQTSAMIAQLTQQHEDDMQRYPHALEILLAAEKELDQLIGDIQSAIAEHDAKIKALVAQVPALRQYEELASPAGGDTDTSAQKGPSHDKGKGTARSPVEQPSSADNYADDNLPHTPAGEEHAIKKRALQQRLRECQIVLHKIHFLKGDVYHILGGPHSDAENKAYATAEDLRRVLLKTTEEAANHTMKQLIETRERGVKEKELYIATPYLGPGGLRSGELIVEANNIIDDVLNKQSELIWQWRSRLITLLSQPLTSSENEKVDGEEYARSLETQGEAEKYLQAYAALLADRREVMISERTLLAAHDGREQVTRRTKAAMKAANAQWAEEGLVHFEDLDAQPEHEVLLEQLNDERKALLEDFNSNRSLRSVMVDINNALARIHKHNDPEEYIIQTAAAKLRTLIGDQGRLMDRLQADLTLLRKAFNSRILYFRQLQELSDSVAEVAWEGSVAEALAIARTESTDLGVKINTGRARQRYLDHLSKSQEQGTLDDDEESCILCKCEFSRGYITQCAHIFCEVCMKSWLLRKEGKGCPVCRVPINSDQLRRFSVDQTTQPPPVKFVNDEPVPKSRREIQYNLIEPDLLERIQTVECHGSYGSKIETLVRHLLFIEMSEPGSKSIVFSAWADSLHIIEHALKSNGISCLRIDQNTGPGKGNAAKRFRTDPSILVLLLHGERENAGLNITCASRVFMVESVVHHAFELQAIARIDRMGQKRPTEVFCYYAEETVERNILDLAVRRGQSLYTKDHAAGTLNTNPFGIETKREVDAPAKAQKGDFVFKTDDMLAIFFPHLYEDVEYLLPQEALSLETNASSGPAEQQQKADSTNATAGPSRLG